MGRYTTIMFAAIYGLLAIVTSLALYRVMDVSIAYAAAMGALIFLSATQAHAFAARKIETKEIKTSIDNLRQSNFELSVKLDDAYEELSGLSSLVKEESIHRNHAIVSEVQVIEQMIETMGDDFNTRLAETARVGAAKLDQVQGTDDKHLMLTLVREALEAGRVELHLQPIVSLPQRKIYYYESFTRLRDHENNVIMPADFIKVAEPAGLISVVDNLLLFRCVQIVRRLTQKDRRIGIVCNISPHSLGDEEFFPQFLDFMRKNSDLAGSLVFEIGQKEFTERSVTEARNMSRLADFGFRFSIDKVQTMDFDLADMKRAGVKFLKVSAEMLLTAIHSSTGGALPAAPDIRVEDMVPYLAGFGIELIGEKVEDEASVVELLEINTSYAQGHLFGTPRPIREEFLEEADEPLKMAS
ncbi:MAG: EAL domain-containing protein [Robiginitomaculum sp.]|nr:EAL domain-containing protein [Robiginitomaculum sp.]